MFEDWLILRPLCSGARLSPESRSVVEEMPVLQISTFQRLLKGLQLEHLIQGCGEHTKLRNACGRYVGRKDVGASH